MRYYLISILVAIAVYLISSVTLDTERINKSYLLRDKTGERTYEPKVLSLLQRRGIAAVIAATSAFATFSCREAADCIQLSKLLLALLCLVGGACVDWIEHRIPNVFPLTMTAGGVLLLSVGCIFGQNGALSCVLENVFAAVLCILFLSIASLLSHHGIGMGDIKLLSALALLGGISILGGTIVFGMVCCVVATVILLLTKMKTIKQSIPFGPFILFGYVVTLLLKRY